MIADEDETIEDDTDNKELLHEVYENGQDPELTRLTEIVRNHYLNYLEKQLHENLINSNYNNNKENSASFEDYDEMCKESIKKTAELLEDRAVKACMIAKFYQRAMVKIIAIVRRTTEEKRLLTHLEKCIKTKDKLKVKTSCKETQTEHLTEVVNSNQHFNHNEDAVINTPAKDEEDNNVMSLDEKIEMFKKHLQKEKCVDIVKKYPLSNNKKKISNRHQKQGKESNSFRRHHKRPEEHHTRHTQEVFFSPTPSVVTAPTTPITPNTNQPPPIDCFSVEVDCKECNVEENENTNDSVAMELARLFSEEKTELDEIFGIDPNEEPDDPQICKILKEIEEANISHTNSVAETTATSTITHSKIENPPPESLLEPKTIKTNRTDTFMSIDLSKSIWPCELFRQRRKLSESLARLIEEDLRWHDIIKWKFFELFGEDSDDEFTPCSPSIELNEVLIGSCIRRISAWVVKYLMRPMRDGLIGNRFLFKKLAKTIARSIIMENQYPDESTIEECVENFFCLHQAVMSLEDLDVNIPSISSSF